MKVIGEVHEGICGASRWKENVLADQKPLRGWAMNLIGKIYLASSKHHCFIIVAIDYFTKWVEAKLVKSTTSQEIITFNEEQIVHKFGTPESITTNRGTFFISREMQDMASRLKIRLL
ncbi:unnamed protein product [Prunus brigantina]